MKKLILSIPIIGPLTIRVYGFFKSLDFGGSKSYWEKRYQQGGNSGAGSYGESAKFKATILNDFVDRNNINRVIEFGCGDGNQLNLADYPHYTGLDVSLTAIKWCKEKFADDKTKNFFFYHQDGFVDNQGLFTSELGLSLDVIYHLVEDDVFEEYLQLLFSTATEYVIIYSTNASGLPTLPHVRHRKFTDWIDANIDGWKLIEHIPTPLPPDVPYEASVDFFIFQREAA